MAETFSPMSPVTRRYAGSLFELAAEARCVGAVGRLLAGFAQMLDKSDDLQRLVRSPVFSARQQRQAVDALVRKAGLEGAGPQGLVGNFLRVVASNRRLFILPAMIEAFHHLAAEARGEVLAEVVSAHALTPAQEKELKTVLASKVGKDVALRVVVDPAILGGLIIRVGSRQIDTSLRTRLSSLKLALKEVG